MIASSLIAALVALRANLGATEVHSAIVPNWSSSRGALHFGGLFQLPSRGCLAPSINGERTESGQLIVGMSEHVTYWNQLGWSDPFSSPAYTERQNAYGTRFGPDSVYTPQMVINGEEQIVGSDNASLLRAVEKEGVLLS
ncbi:MAG: hypothetical protein JWQ42_4684 [Edaphobacter sp.]|nr:hypothetical protein [Edaphobacter sp.]